MSKSVTLRRKDAATGMKKKTPISSSAGERNHYAARATVPSVVRPVVTASLAASCRVSLASGSLWTPISAASRWTPAADGSGRVSAGHGSAVGAAARFPVGAVQHPPALLEDFIHLA